ncbi:MAG: hypothetical protein ACR5KV_06435 [Wolbachia sp.]
MAKITLEENKESIDILYNYHSTIFGKVFIGVTTQSICHLSFYDFETSTIEILEKEWPQACLKEDRLITAKLYAIFLIYKYLRGHFLCLLGEQIFKLKSGKH